MSLTEKKSGKIQGSLTRENLGNLEPDEKSIRVRFFPLAKLNTGEPFVKPALIRSPCMQLLSVWMCVHVCLPSILLQMST